VSLQSGLLLALLVLAVLGASLAGRLSCSLRSRAEPRASSLRSRAEPRASTLPHGALLRSLFPSWRFFDANEPSLCLYARVLQGEREIAPFAPLLPAHGRGALALLFNPRGNLLLACHSLLDRLVSELAERGPTPIEEAERLVSYRLVQNLALRLLAREPSTLGLQYQLKLEATGPEPGEREELLLSPLYPLS
jgi:hypothetical protein